MAGYTATEDVGVIDVLIMNAVAVKKNGGHDRRVRQVHLG